MGTLRACHDSVIHRPHNSACRRACVQFVTLTTVSAVLLTVIAAEPVTATTYVVAPDGSGDFPTIQAAIDATVNGDVIGFATRS